MTTVAFVEIETGWHPCHIGDIKRGQTYFIVRDGVQGEVSAALEDARLLKVENGESVWSVEGKPVE